ncbi:MAG TPA: hypothetical protein VEQ16_02830, partial [Acidocella sp.]|nr:hypothetical protein [Acidocella sp.]
PINNVMARRRPAFAKRAANISRADDSEFHVPSPFRIKLGKTWRFTKLNKFNECRLLIWPPPPHQ